MTIQLTEESLQEMVIECFDTMLGLQVKPSDNANKLNFDEILKSSVWIRGESELEFIVFAPDPLATQIACSMFQMEAADLDEQLVKDAVGEVANILGGNVKSQVDATGQLSLPEVDVCDNSTGGPSPYCNRLILECDGHPLLVFLCNGEFQPENEELLVKEN